MSYNHKIIVYYKNGGNWHHELTYNIVPPVNFREVFDKAEKYIYNQFKNPMNLHEKYKILYQQDEIIIEKPNDKGE